jgi:hypothetical protein
MKSERRKQRERTAVADLVIGVLAPVIAPIIARVLAMFPVDEAKEFLENHLKLGDLLIPLEHLSENSIFRVLTEAAGGSVAGYTVATIAETIYPGLSAESGDYLQDLALVVTEQYAELKRAKGETATTATITSDESPQKKRDEERVTMVIIVRGELVYHHDSCPVLERTVKIPGRPPGRDGKGGTPDKVQNRTDLQSMEIELVEGMPTMTPAVCCAGIFTVEKRRAAREAAANAPKVEPAKPGKVKPLSFSDLHGKALASSDPTLRASAEHLRSVITNAKLKPPEYALLERCDTMDEYRALAGCTNADELRAFIRTLRARDERGLLSEGAQEVGLFAGQAIAVLGGLRDKSKTRADELRRQRTVLDFCTRQGVQWEEVLDVTPGRSGLDDLTLADARAAVAEDPQTHLTPIAAYRQKKNPTPTTTNQQPTGAVQGGRPGLGRRLRRWVW